MIFLKNYQFWSLNTTKLSLLKGLVDELQTESTKLSALAHTLSLRVVEYDTSFPKRYLGLIFIYYINIYIFGYVLYMLNLQPARVLIKTSSVIWKCHEEGDLPELYQGIGEVLGFQH